MDTEQNGNTNADETVKINIEEIDRSFRAAPETLRTDLQFIDCYKAYSGYVLVERGVGLGANAKLFLPTTAKGETWSFVHSVGPEVKYGCLPGDFIVYIQGTDLKLVGPNGGGLYMIPENQIGAICPKGEPWPRAAPVTSIDPALAARNASAARAATRG